MTTDLNNGQFYKFIKKVLLLSNISPPPLSRSTTIHTTFSSLSFSLLPITTRHTSFTLAPPPSNNSKIQLELPSSTATKHPHLFFPPSKSVTITQHPNLILPFPQAPNLTNLPRPIMNTTLPKRLAMIRKSSNRKRSVQVLPNLGNNPINECPSLNQGD